MQIEYAAEMGFEHNLGLTCDPWVVTCKFPASSEMPLLPPELWMQTSTLPSQMAIIPYLSTG